MRTAINLSDSKRRYSRVIMVSGRSRTTQRPVFRDHHPAIRYRAVKNTIETGYNQLVEDCTPEELSQHLIEADPEIDIELYGKRVDRTSRIYLNKGTEQPAFGVRVKASVYDASGELKEVRPSVVVENNINLEKPLKWSGRFLPRKDFYRKFAFVHAFQLTHVDGLTYDFLYEMAKELEEKDAFLLVAAGDKASEPLVFQRNGTAYRGFLEGRTRGAEYLLILHLTNLELKPIPVQEDDKD